MNKFIVTGRLTADPELTETAGGVSLCRFSIAVQRDYKTDDEYKTDFFEVTAWRDLAETVARYSKKGDKVLVEGSIQPRQYEDNKGTKHKTVDIIVHKVEFLTPRAKDTTAESDRGYSGGGRSNRPVPDYINGDIPF